MPDSGSGGDGLPPESSPWAAVGTTWTPLLKAYPIPMPPRRPWEPSGSARGSRRACHRREAHQDLRNSVRYLNWMAGHRGRLDRRIKFATSEHWEMYARLEAAIAERRLCTAIPSRREAFAELLRGRGVYSEAACNVEKYTHVDDVSLPTDLSKAPRLVDILPDEPLQYAVDLERMLRPTHE